nr:protein BOBBER 1-like [Ipomoea batatas]
MGATLAAAAGTEMPRGGGRTAIVLCRCLGEESGGGVESAKMLRHLWTSLLCWPEEGEKGRCSGRGGGRHSELCYSSPEEGAARCCTPVVAAHLTLPYVDHAHQPETEVVAASSLEGEERWKWERRKGATGVIADARHCFADRERDEKDERITKTEMKDRRMAAEYQITNFGSCHLGPKEVKRKPVHERLGPVTIIKKHTKSPLNIEPSKEIKSAVPFRMKREADVNVLCGEVLKARPKIIVHTSMQEENEESMKSSYATYQDGQDVEAPKSWRLGDEHESHTVVPAIIARFLNNALLQSSSESNRNRTVFASRDPTCTSPSTRRLARISTLITSSAGLFRLKRPITADLISISANESHSSSAIWTIGTPEDTPPI